MAKNKMSYLCSACGSESPKWAGQCGDCGSWNSLQEQLFTTPPTPDRFTGYAGGGREQRVISLAQIEASDVTRISVGMGEFNRVLGGGLVPGSVVLIGGNPGIGKSTLLLQTIGTLAESLGVLYITGEESPQQVSLRAQRLKLAPAKIRMLAETQVERILNAITLEKPAVVVIDSIQTIYSEQIPSAPGSVTQVRESSTRLVRYAKERGVAIFIVGHVTKDGQLAGPRILEHMVDTVLYFEGESNSRYRVIRAFKNRFGAVNELGVFAMTDLGLKEVANPSALFLSNREENTSGSAVMVTLEGSRPLLVEVQSLVDESSLGNPRRVTVGLDGNRLAMLLAVLHRHAGIQTFNQDIFANVVGGVRVNETAADLALVLAIYSSLRDRPLPQRLVVFGEIGLSGEIRPVPNGEDRIREAAKHGFNRAIVPAANLPRKTIAGIEVQSVKRLADAFDYL